MKDTNQKKFLKAFAQCGTVKGAAVAAGITRQAVYLWRSGEPEFEDAFQEARDEFADRLEEIALDRLTHPEGGRGGDLLLITLLNAHKPEKYRANTTEQTDNAKTVIKELRAMSKKAKDEEEQLSKDDNPQSTIDDQLNTILKRKGKK
ncbi:hypothetical protein M1N17_03165 [Dehalococcoidia bacterium]|nr:hypothetical protein [Dehalococcoidia bacterium]